MPETFSPIIWRNDQSPALNETNLNRLEQGVELLDDRIARGELGVVDPIMVPYATSVTLNATQGALFRCMASGDLTLDDIVGGIDGQTIVFEVQASGAQRVLHFTGSTDTVTIATGQWWVGTFRFVASDNSWLLDDGSGGNTSSTGGSGNDLNVLSPQNVPYAATVTLNAATGALFRITAPGDFTLANPINGTNGQGVVIEVLASGGTRTISFASGDTPAVVLSGQRWTGTLRYNATDNVWVLANGSGGSDSASLTGRVGSLERGVLTPQTVAYASTITLNAALGGLFRIAAIGDFTLNDPTGGTDGQVITLEVLASGAARTVGFAGNTATSVVVPSGARWVATLRYNAGGGTWLMDDNTGGGSSANGSVESVNGLTGAVVLDADDLADGSTRVQMTTAERTKLTSVATGATANATDAQLRNRATHTGTQPVTSLATTGTASATTYLRGDGAWSAPVASSVAVNSIDVPSVGDVTQRIAWVAYAHPLLPAAGPTNYWDRALKVAPVLEIMIVNIDAVGGPGTSVNSDYQTAIAKAKASGVTIVGYVDTTYTGRTTATVTSEVNTWRSLYPNIDGIFFDQVSVNPVDVPYYQTLYNHVKNTFPITTRRLVILNPGVFTDEAYMTCSDVIMNFENTPANYRTKFSPAWERNYPARRFWHVVHSITGLDELQEMQVLSRQYRAGYVYLTNDVMPNPFDVLPDDPFWSRQVAQIARGGAQYPVDLSGPVTIGGDNGMNSIRLRGRKTTTGAPTSGTWVAGDAIIDSAGTWHLCTAGGTPGTWT